jgi:hypothetical protein
MKPQKISNVFNLNLQIQRGGVIGVSLIALTSSAVADALYTTNQSGTAVNQNTYTTSTDVYISGGPQNINASGLPDGTYYFQVTDPSGATLLSTDIALCRQVAVSGGHVNGAAGPACKHAIGAVNPADSSTPVQLFPFNPTPNAGGQYRAWLIPAGAATVSPSDPTVLVFDQSVSRTDNFKVQKTITPPPSGSCQGSSSLTTIVTGYNVLGYVPKGSWPNNRYTPSTGVSVINIEGSGITPTKISTPNVVNSCAPNPLTSQTVCTANNTDVYLITGTTLTNTLASGGSGTITFSGGRCTNCGVTIDAIHNKAAIGLSVGGAPGFQILDLGSSPTFEPPFKSPAGKISEQPLFDPTHNLLLSPTEGNDYEIIDLTQSTAPVFYENQPIPVTSGILDSAAEECSTGIAIAPGEQDFANPVATQVFIADLTQAGFTAGSPAGTWSAPSQVQSLVGSGYNIGGSAIAQGTHTGVLAGEFQTDLNGLPITAIKLPAASGNGTPAISDWVACYIGNGFQAGYDPHTVSAYQSPNTGDAMAVFSNGGASTVAIVDLTKMLDPTIVPRTAGFGGHHCLSVTLPSTVVSFVPVP